MNLRRFFKTQLQKKNPGKTSSESLRFWGFGFLFPLVLGVNTWVQASSDSPTPLKNVWFAEVRSALSPATADYLELSIQRAEEDQAVALVVELDTPGGLVSSVRSMAQLIQKSRVPVIVTVTPAGASATSAGALFMLAAHRSAMAPGTAIGAAHPVGSSGEQLEGAVNDKATQDTAAFARGLAEIRGRNVSLAERMVTESLSLTAAEAHRQKVVDYLVSDRTDLLRQLDGAEVLLGEDHSKAQATVLRTREVGWKTSEMTPGQKLLVFLADPNVATLLMTLGMLAIYVEISAPGFGLPGILGGISLLIAIMSYQLLPIRTGGLLLLALGVIFFVAEIFASSHGLLAFGGALAFALGALWVMDPSASSLQVSALIWLPAVLMMGGGALLIAYFATRSRTLTERLRRRIGGERSLGLSGYVGHVESVDSSGLKGKALIRGEVWDFVSTDPVREQDLVEVFEAQGLKVFVKKSSDSSSI